MSLGKRIIELIRGASSGRVPGSGLLEIHIPISPNPHFFTMLHYFVASLKVNGGALADSRVVVTVGEDCEPYDLDAVNSWAKNYNLEWRWLDRELFRKRSFYATSNQRFRYEYSAPVVMISDADTFITGDLSGLAQACLKQRAFAGVIAHAPPFDEKIQGSVAAMWRQMYANSGLGEPVYGYEHTGFGVMRQGAEDRYCPPYFNFGMLIAPADVMHRLGNTLDADTVSVERVHETFFKCQIALTLSLVRMGAAIDALPMRFNFPNDDRIAQKYPEELENVRVFHYLRRHIGPFDKTRDFADYDAMDAFLRRPGLEGVNRVMQQALLRVQPRIQEDLSATARGPA